MSEATAAPPPPPPPPSPPRWGIISSVPGVFDEKDDDDDSLSMSDLFDLSLDILHPPSISRIVLSRKFYPVQRSTEVFPRIFSVDPMGLFLLYIPRPDLIVCLPDAGRVDTVPYPSPPLPNLGNTGIISYPGFSKNEAYAICELTIHSSHSATLRSYSTPSGTWTISTELQCDGDLPEDWGKSGWVMSHDRKLWWIDLSYGIITCDPFAEGFLEKQCDPFAELQQLHFIPLPGPSVPPKSQDYFDKTRCVNVSNKKLRYVLLQPCCADIQAPCVSVWTLDDPDTALWSLQYTVSLSEVASMPLAEVTPTLALIHPLDPNVVYFFENGWILAVDVQLRKVISSQKYTMVFPPVQNHCARFVYAYQPLRNHHDEEVRTFAAAPDPVSSVRCQDSSQQENPNARSETLGNTAKSHKGKKNFSHRDVGVFSQSSVLHDNPTSSVHVHQLAKQGHGNGCTKTVRNAVENHRGKLITPANFCSDTLLSESDVHLFVSAQDLRKSIDDSTSQWLDNKQASAMLKNPNIFQVTDVGVVTDEKFRADGSCMLADDDLLKKIQPGGHAYSTKRDYLIEKTSKIPGTKLCQHMMKGNLWERRRLSIQGDDRFSVIQWRTGAKMAGGGQAHRRGCEELSAKGVSTNELPPAKPEASRRIHDAEAVVSNRPRRTKGEDSGLSRDDRINQLQTGLQKIMKMLERIDQIDEHMNQLQAGQQKIMETLERIDQIDEHMNQLQAGQQKIMEMLERIGQIAPVPTPVPSRPPSASAQARRSPTPVEDRNTDDADHRT